MDLNSGVGGGDTAPDGNRTAVPRSLSPLGVHCRPCGVLESFTVHNDHWWNRQANQTGASLLRSWNLQLERLACGELTIRPEHNAKGWATLFMN